MPGEFTRYPAAGERIERLLAELHTGPDEAERFIAGMFDQLEVLGARLGQPRAKSPTRLENELQQRLRAMAQSQSTMEQQRVVLEAELQSLRSRAAEMAETIQTQKQQIQEQQDHWGRELQRMGRLQEGIAQRVSDSGEGGRSTCDLPHVSSSREMDQSPTPAAAASLPGTEKCA